jgi:hypothetical protein
MQHDSKLSERSQGRETKYDKIRKLKFYVELG